MARRSGVSFIELLVVLAILAILLGLLLPAVQSSRVRARETVCKNNLHQLNLAVAQFAEAHKRIPDPVPPGRVGGWTIEVLPFLDQEALKRGVRPGTTIADAGATLRAPPRVFLCPMREALEPPPEATMASGHYVLVAASGRDSYSLFDSPVDHVRSWASGPEMSHDSVARARGPHHGGFFYSQGFQQGVSFKEPASGHDGL